MGNKLYVGNLRFTVTDESLKDLFTPFGTVQSAKIITDRYSGLSKGFGFVEMNSEVEAAEAIEKMNGKEFDGRALTVSEARPQTPREDGGGYKGGPGRPGGGGGRGRTPKPRGRY